MEEYLATTADLKVEKVFWYKQFSGLTSNQKEYQKGKNTLKVFHQQFCIINGKTWQKLF